MFTLCSNAATLPIMDEWDDKGGIPGIESVTPTLDKETRAEIIGPMMEAGLIWVPMDGQAPWIDEFINELTGFPAGRFKDRVDAMSQAMEYMRGMRGRNSRTPAGSYMSGNSKVLDDDDWSKVPPPPNAASGRGYM